MVICVMDILVVNAASWKNRHEKGGKWLVTHKIYINNNKTYSGSDFTSTSLGTQEACSMEPFLVNLISSALLILDIT